MPAANSARVTDNKNGTYSATYTAGTKTGTETIGATIGGKTVSSKGAVTVVSGPANLPSSTMARSQIGSGSSVSPALGRQFTNDRVVDAALQALLLDESTVTGKPRACLNPDRRAPLIMPSSAPMPHECVLWPIPPVAIPSCRQRELTPLSVKNERMGEAPGSLELRRPPPPPTRPSPLWPPPPPAEDLSRLPPVKTLPQTQRHLLPLPPGLLESAIQKAVVSPEPGGDFHNTGCHHSDSLE